VPGVSGADATVYAAVILAVAPVVLAWLVSGAGIMFGHIRRTWDRHRLNRHLLRRIMIRLEECCDDR
jgi:hypothetical protein